MKRNPTWATPYGAAQQCSIAFTDFKRLLAEDGVDCDFMWVEGPIPPDAPRAHPRAWLSKQHRLVVVDDEVIDFTRRQWDLEADFPTVYLSLEAVDEHWSRRYPIGVDYPDE